MKSIGVVHGDDGVLTIPALQAADDVPVQVSVGGG